MKGTLLIGSLPRIVAPIARSLHARGIPVHGASLAPDGRRIRSRAFTSFTTMTAEVASGAFIEELRKIIVTHDIDTIIPCADDVIQAIAPHDSALRGLVSYCGPSPESCRKIIEKSETLSLAADAGIPVPGEYRALDRAALTEIKNLIRFPIVAKPKDKEIEAVTGVKSKVLRSFQELCDEFDRIPEFGSLFLMQDFIPGFGVGVEVLMDRGNPLTVFQHRRVREYPVQGGVSVAAVSEARDPLLVTYAVTLLQALEWQGVAMVEFRKDDCGAVALMEVNGRFWGSVALSLYCGMQFPYYVWQLAHGHMPRPPASYPVGTRFRWLAGDIRRVYELLGLPSARRFQAAADFVREFSSAAKDATWVAWDPIPAFEETARACAGISLTAAKSIAKRLIPAIPCRRIKAMRNVGLSRVLGYLKARFVSHPGTIKLQGPIRSVVFICHGNIIRSPMAEAIFRSEQPGIPVNSAGTDATPGREVDARAAQVAREFGVTLDGHTATRVSRKTVEFADLLVVMDYFNYVALIESFPEAASKTVLLRAEQAEIDDPYDGDLNDIRAVYRVVEHATRALIKRLAV